MPNKVTPEFVKAVEKKLVDQGLIIEAGWAGFTLMAIPPEAPPLQLQEMRSAFFAGAMHLFSSIMSIMEPGTEPTEKDLKRVSLIHDELDRFIKAFTKKHGLDPGTEH